MAPAGGAGTPIGPRGAASPPDPQAGRRIAGGSALILAIALASVALANGGGPTILPVEPGSGIGH